MYFVGVYAYAILKDEAVVSPEELRKDLKAIVRQKIGSFAVPDVIQVSSRPKNRSYCSKQTVIKSREENETRS